MTDIPAGFKLKGNGDLVPVTNIRPQDLLQDELAIRLVEGAKSFRAALTVFKHTAMDEIQALKTMIAQEYDAQLGGAKGNMTLRSFDGRQIVEISVSDTIDFGPELLAAKELIDACLARWSEGADGNIRALVTHAFQVNKTGRIDKNRIFDLRNIDIDKTENPEWGKAMDAISDAVRIVSSKVYVRFYEVDEHGKRAAVSLDLAAL